MLEISDKNKFAKVVAEAIASAHKTCKSVNRRDRWIRAIGRAVAEIENNGTFMEFDHEERHLVIWSQESNRIYTANGVCQCEAYTGMFRVPCWHRAACGLVRNYFGLTENLSPSFPEAKQAVSSNILPPASPSLAAETKLEMVQRINAAIDNAPYITPPSRTRNDKVEGFRL